MRGSDARSGSLLSYVDIEQRVPTQHPLRVIKAIVEDVLFTLDAEFEGLYEGTGRQSIVPEATPFTRSSAPGKPGGPVALAYRWSHLQRQ